METHSFTLELKSLSDQGTFTGIASTASIDRQSDVVKSGALYWDDSGIVPMLYQHKHDEVIGVFKNLSYTDEGLRVNGEINLDVLKGREVYSLLKQGALKALSVGFVIEEKTTDGPVRVITKGQLLEISLVTIPANPEAIVTSVKEADSLTSELEALKTAHRLLIEENQMLQLAYELSKLNRKGTK